MAPRRPFAIVVCFEDRARQRFVLARHEDRGWEIPGGHVEDGETAAEAAAREFGEEIGREVVGLQPVLVQEREVGRCHVFTGRLGEPVDEGGKGDESVVDWRLVERLDDVEPLAFPNDPYEAIEDELGVELGAPG